MTRPTRNAIASRVSRVIHVSRSSAFGFATIRIENVTPFWPPSLIGYAAARYDRSSPGGSNSKLTILSVLSGTPTSARDRRLSPESWSKSSRNEGARTTSNRRSPVAASSLDAANVGAALSSSSARTAHSAYRSASPRASCRNSCSDSLRVKSWKSRSAIRLVTSPASAIPARKSAGRRKRRELSTVLS